MIRVGFIIQHSHLKWIGGINYFRNLISAILALPGHRIEPVVIAGRGIEYELKQLFPDVQVVQTSLLNRFHLSWIFRKVLKKILNRDWLLESVLLRHSIQILSHSGSLGYSSKVKTIAWIPDFQHKYFPHFFSQKFLVGRDREFLEYCKYCDIVLLSSTSSQIDFKKFFPDFVGKSRVLRFVPAPHQNLIRSDVNDLCQKFHIGTPYFLLPNQFWAHKNHRIVIDAVKRLKTAGKNIRVVCTGETQDLRNRDYFASLRRYIEQSEVDGNFIILGNVPENDLYSLMHHTLAMINPSFFEGWSTSVEEGISLGKRLILSDIPVHREQNAPYAIYFDPKNVLSLSEILWSVWKDGKPEKYGEKSDGLSDQEGRWKEFGKDYENIVGEAVSLFSSVETALLEGETD